MAPLGLQSGVNRTSVVIADDWPADSMLDMGTITCPGGELVWADPATGPEGVITGVIKKQRVW